MTTFAAILAAARPLLAALRDDSVCLDDAVDAARACAVLDLSRAVDDAIARAVGSDRERYWDLSHDSEGYRAVKAMNARDAVEHAVADVNYPAGERTQWYTATAHCPLTDETAERSVEVDPTEPDCDDGAAHEWESPFALVGGCKSNPGVFGHGGGVVVHEVCMICGCERITDTWAQRPDTGEDGLTSVSYEPGAYADEVRRMREDMPEEIAGYEVRERSGGGWLVIAGADDADDALREIREAGFVADFTGDGGTDGTGYDTTDIAIEGRVRP